MAMVPPITTADGWVVDADDMGMGQGIEDDWIDG
jgi:hypothetical protein